MKALKHAQMLIKRQSAKHTLEPPNVSNQKLPPHFVTHQY